MVALLITFASLFILSDILSVIFAKLYTGEKGLERSATGEMILRHVSILSKIALVVVLIVLVVKAIMLLF